MNFNRVSTLFIIFLFSCLSVGAENVVITGKLLVKQNNFQLISTDKKVYSLVPINQEVLHSLKQLSTGDSIQGAGQVKNNQTLILDSIDFVGIKKLLGGWQSSDGFFSFENYEDLTLYNFSSHLMLGKKSAMKYALTPSEDSQWKIFIIQNGEVVLANLDFVSDTMMTLNHFNSKSGNISKKTILIKVNN
jgi:hypothetical protein